MIMPNTDITNLQTLDIHYLSKTQYNDLLESSELDENAIYMTPSEGELSSVTIRRWGDE